MFNKTYVQQSKTEYVPYEKEVTIHEHKAPTDESVRLFKELQEKALKSITEVVRLEDNVISGAFIRLGSNFSFSSEQEYLIAFKINGKEFIVKFKVLKLRQMKQEDFIKEFTKAFSAQLEYEILKAISPSQINRVLNG